MTKQTQKKNVSTQAGDKLLASFSDAFYKQVPAEDLAGWKTQDLNTVAASMLAFVSERQPGKQKLRVFTPEMKRDGWHVPHTIIQIVNDDMPFIIDSVTSELAFQNLSIDILFHPILSVERSKGGRLESLNGKLTESYVFIGLEHMVSEEVAQKLEQRLYAILDDVRAATGDWHAMMAKIETVAEHTHDQESREFLQYLRANNFTFLGYRALQFSGANNTAQSKAVAGSDLGVLKVDYQDLCFGRGVSSPEIKAIKSSKYAVMVTKLVDQYATVHRRVPMDAIGVKMFDAQGNLAGMHLFVGLFTSSTYSCRTADVPIVRQKVRETIQRAGFSSGTHDRKALEHILEKMPRDDIFLMTTEELYDTALGYLRLQAKQRVALFAHMDPMRQYMSCLVYVPRDRYNNKFRRTAESILAKALHGEATNYFTTLDDSPLARILYTIRLDGNMPATFNAATVEQQLIEIGREWDERLKHVLIAAHGKKRGAELTYIYGKAFTSAYHEAIDINNAMHDVKNLEALVHGDDKICIDFYRLNDAPASEVRLKVYHKHQPVPLSDILPVLENMGLKCQAEMPYEVRPQGFGGSIWIHDFVLQGGENVKIDEVKANFEETFLQVWRGLAENDGINQLVLLANLNWSEARVLRAYNSYMRQARFPFSRTYIEQVLGMYPHIARELVALFKDMHDPKVKTPTEKRGKIAGEKITDLLQAVQKADHDRILRSFKTLIEKTLRTNYFQTDEHGMPKPALAMKFDSKNIPELPLPRPFVEIFVYSARVEAIHLRGGMIARGGIRWSDRHDDFRTEVLSLMKAQQVKNAVIVPVGAKGGFIVKQPPKTGGREAYQQEGIDCYKIFVQAMLDLTDNNVNGKIIRPTNVVCHDGVDSYLVVAADKGTATFSNIANELSTKANFWLQDAFASGGSTGYDHKGIGITARGGWESVKRHFREMGKDIQKEPFTLVGVGDMAGDVFGNAMLLSKQMQLLGAFNHVHIFCDPSPDIAKSFAERERLFETRGGWDMYDKKVLSQGGMIYERSAKTLKLTPQIRKCFGLNSDTVTPDELIQAILKAQVELIWFGGIGTYIKSSRQSQADADDKSNDALRVDGSEIRAKVIGEGANLGVTQLGRIEYAQNGGRINTDFIDNSGGVDCSDHEVNIKILLADVMAKGKMTLPQRNKLLEQMTDDVANLVLRDNYQQTQSLSFVESKAKELLGLHAEFIRELEKSGLTRRSLEGLPDDETLARLARDGKGLSRPELCVLLPYAKMILFNQILSSGIPDDPTTDWLLFDYFPKVLHKFEAEIKNHKLKREIIATQIANIIVNRMGPVFVRSRVMKTGVSVEAVVRACMIVGDSFRVRDVWKSIEDLDNKVPAGVQMMAFFEVSQVLKRAVTWLLRFGSVDMKIAAETAALKSGMDVLKKNLDKVMPESVRQEIRSDEEKLADAGMPQKIAADIAVMTLMASANDIIMLSRQTKGDIPSIASTYFQIGEKFGLDWLRQKTSRLRAENAWQAQVVGSLMDDFFGHQAALTQIILASTGKKQKMDDWFEQHQGKIEKIAQMVSDVKREKAVALEMLVLISQRIGQMVQQVK